MLWKRGAQYNNKTVCGSSLTEIRFDLLQQML